MDDPENSNDELGLSEEQLEEAQAKLKAETVAYEREFWSRPKRYFFVFKTEAERNAATEALSRAREYSEVLLQLGGWQKDPERKDVGLQLNFQHGQEGLRERLKTLFAKTKYQDRTFQILEDYAPDDAMVESREKVVEMPKRGEAMKRSRAA